MKKLSFLVLALLILIPSLASAKIGSRNLDKERKAVRWCTPVAVASTKTTTGSDGLIVLIELDGATPSDAASTDYAMMSYPAKVGVSVDDAVNGGVVACTSVKITGITMLGNKTTEELTTVSDAAAVTTTNVFEQVTAVDVSGCTGQAVNDHVEVYTSQEIGLGVKIKTASDLERACIIDQSDATDMKCASADNGTANDIASAIEVTSSTLDLSVSLFGDVLGSETAVADGDTVCFTVRPSF